MSEKASLSGESGLKHFGVAKPPRDLFQTFKKNEHFFHNKLMRNLNVFSKIYITNLVNKLKPIYLVKFIE